MGSRHGSGASQEGMNVLLCYPESCLREVAQDSMLMALYVARCAWALTLHPSQAWVELSFYHVVTVYGAASVHWESLLFHASGCQLCHLGGSPIKKGWRGPAVYAQCPPSFIVVLREGVGASKREGSRVVTITALRFRGCRLSVGVCAVALVSIVAWRVDREVCVDVWVVVRWRSRTTVQKGHSPGILYVWAEHDHLS